MPRNYPKDRFDHRPRSRAHDRVGAHRAPSRKGRGWVTFWWALAATLVLIVVGVFALFSLSSRLNFDLSALQTGSASPSSTAKPTPTPTPTPTAPPTAEPTVDPSLDVTVLNGTPETGIAAGVGDLLTTAGWSVGSMSDADSTEVPKTVVYYAEANLEGAARGVAASLPGATIQLADDFADSGASLTVVVGNDYVPPAD